jgi:hypothetical protein
VKKRSRVQYITRDDLAGTGYFPGFITRQQIRDGSSEQLSFILDIIVQIYRAMGKYED